MSQETSKLHLTESVDTLGQPEAAGTGTINDPELIRSNIFENLSVTAERAAYLASRVRDKETLDLAVGSLFDVLHARQKAEDAGIRISDFDELLRS